jgi:ABC-type transport system involved in multi-copper enzyme maturation permease subunit
MASKAVASNERAWSLGNAIERFNPFAYFLGPVFEKEVRVGGRRLQTYVQRAFAAFLLLIVVVTTGITQMSWNTGGGAAQRVQELQTLAPTVAYVVAWVQMVALTLLAPLLMAPALCEERRTKTLSALLTTPLTARQIVFGTLVGRWVQIVILALIAAPLLFGLRVLGGVPAWFVFAITAIILSTSLVGAACGILCSALGTRPVSAIFIAVLFTLLSLFGPALAIYFLRTEFGILLPTAATAVTSGPIALVALQRVLAGDELHEFALHLTLGNTAWNLALSGVYSLITILVFRRVMRNEAGAGQVAAGSRPLISPTTPAIAAASDPVAPQVDNSIHDRLRSPLSAQSDLTQTDVTANSPPAAAVSTTTDANSLSAEDRAVRLAAASRTVGDNPVLWRELRQSIFTHRWHSVVVILAITALLTWIAAETWGSIEAHMPTQIIGMLIIITQAALSTVGGITTERETKSWDVLVGSPLSARQILLGKIAGAMRRQVLVPGFLIAYLFIVGVIPGQLHPVALIHFVLVWLGTIALFAGTGVLLSLHLSKTSSAASVNLGIALFIWFIIPLCILMAQGLGARFIPNAWFDYALNAVSHLNPVVLIVSAIDGAFDENGRWSPDFNYNTPSGTYTLNLFTFTFSCAAYATLAAGLGLAAAAYGTKRFNTLAGRAS